MVGAELRHTGPLKRVFPGCLGALRFEIYEWNHNDQGTSRVHYNSIIEQEASRGLVIPTKVNAIKYFQLE